MKTYKKPAYRASEKQVKLYEDLKKFNESRKRPVVCLNDGLGFASLNDAGLYYNLDPSGIAGVCKGMYNKMKGYKFEFKELN